MSPVTPVLKCDECGYTRQFPKPNYPLLENLLDARDSGWRIDLKRNVAFCQTCRHAKEE